MKWYLMPWKKYFEFKGRARRKEFWTFMLINMGIGYIITAFFPSSITSSGTFHRSAADWIFSSITFLPSIAVTVRRLHDTNRNGGLVWLLLIPIVGWIIMLFWMGLDSNLGENDYGPDPKAEKDTSFSSVDSI